jgi:hypothetical protein
MSSNFSTRNSKYSVLYFFIYFFWTLPYSKKSIKFINNCSSLVCWPILNLNKTWYLCFTVLLFLISIWKLPSPEANPATQLGSEILLILNSDSILRGLISGKANFNLGLRR